MLVPPVCSVRNLGPFHEVFLRPPLPLPLDTRRYIVLALLSPRRFTRAYKQTWARGGSALAGKWKPHLCGAYGLFTQLRGRHRVSISRTHYGVNHTANHPQPLHSDEWTFIATRVTTGACSVGFPALLLGHLRLGARHTDTALPQPTSAPQVW